MSSDRSNNLTPIGNLTSKILPMRQNETRSSTQNGASSPTTALQTTSPAPTSTPIGGRGATTISSGLRNALAEGNAESVDRALQALLVPSLKRLLDTQVTVDYETIGYRARGPIPVDTKAEWSQLLSMLNAPSTSQLIAQEASRCLSLTASRQREGMDLDVMAQALMDELMEFPPDVVKTALRNWARREKWWPTLAEIREDCLRLCRIRRSLAAVMA